jgi:integrase
MVKVDLGIHKVTAKGRTYYYAWRGRGAPRLQGAPGTPEFVRSLAEAIENRRTPDKSRFRSLVADYRGSDAFTKLEESTRRNWSPWLDRIAEYFGELRIAQFERLEKIRPVVRQWRQRFADKPRTADYGMQVLSRVLAHAIDIGKLAANPCEGIGALYIGDRSEIIWTDADIDSFKSNPACTAELALAVDLAAHTGLRLGDLIRLAWTHVGDDAVVIATGKSREKREAIIPIYDELRELLDRLPKHSPLLLTSARQQPWTQSGLSSAVQRVKVKGGWDRDLHFHDLRGTACTKFYVAGLDARVIAEIMGWEEKTVEKIIRRYVGRHAATQAVVERMREARKQRQQYTDNVVPLGDRKQNEG